jgi:hypothetical protein
VVVVWVERAALSVVTDADEFAPVGEGAVVVCFFPFAPTAPPTAAPIITTITTTAMIMIPFLVR